MEESRPIEIEDITDITIIIHAKEQKWLVIPRQGVDKDTAREMRKILISMIVSQEKGLHAILDHPYNQELMDKLKAKQDDTNN